MGGLSVSAAKKKRIQAPKLWLNESLHIVRVKVEDDFDDTMFTTTNMTEMFDESYIHYLDNNTNSDVIYECRLLLPVMLIMFLHYVACLCI